METLETLAVVLLFGYTLVLLVGGTVSVVAVYLVWRVVDALLDRLLK